MIKLAIFDLDGTLLNTLTDLRLCVNRTMVKYGCPQYEDAQIRMMVGSGYRNLMRKASGIQEPALLERICRDYSALYAAGYNDHTAPYPGIPEALDVLARAGVAVAVLSNKPEDMTRLLIREHFPNIRFTAVYGQREGVPMKPDPTAALEICAAAGCTPAETAHFGDSGTDMRLARNLGALACGVTWGFRDRDELLEAGAQTLLEIPSEIPCILCCEKD